MLDIGVGVRFCRPRMSKRPRELPRSAPPEDIIAAAAAVLGGSTRAKPADAVLREEMKRRDDLPALAKREISATVFTYYRWRGWLGGIRSVEARMERALELDRRFRMNPFTLSEEALRRKAVPEWLADFMDYPVHWLRSLQREPSIWIRARPGQARALAKKVGDCRPAKDTSLFEALQYRGTKDLFVTKEFREGEFEIQDISSQAVGCLCAPQPGETWWDLCAGEGGKLLHLSDLMANRGLIWATDRVEWRLERLRARAARAKCFNYRSVPWDGSQPPPFQHPVDGVLVDAPCSGIGTWHRNPHARWTLTPGDVHELAHVQVELLRKASAWVRPGGRLIYAVCTLTRAETIQVVATFGREAKGWEPLLQEDPFRREMRASQFMYWPQTTHGNGMFVAAWVRTKPDA